MSHEAGNDPSTRESIHQVKQAAVARARATPSGVSVPDTAHGVDAHMDRIAAQSRTAHAPREVREGVEGHRLELQLAALARGKPTQPAGGVDGRDGRFRRSNRGEPDQPRPVDDAAARRIRPGRRPRPIRQSARRTEGQDQPAREAGSRRPATGIEHGDAQRRRAPPDRPAEAVRRRRPSRRPPATAPAAARDRQLPGAPARARQGRPHSVVEPC